VDRLKARGMIVARRHRWGRRGHPLRQPGSLRRLQRHRPGRRDGASHDRGW